MALNRREFLAGALAIPALSCVARHGAGASRASDRLGASTACLAGLTLVDALQRIRELGFGTVEIIAYTGARHSVGAIPGFSYSEAGPRERERVFDVTRAFRHISAHLPFQDVQLFSSDRAARDAGVKHLQSALEGLAYLRGEFGVMHIGWPERGRSFRDIWRPMIDTLRALGDFAADRNLALGIETMQPDSVRDYTELVVAVDHPRVGAVIDTGHIRGSTDIGIPAERRSTDEGRARFNDVLDALVAGLGDKLLHVHLSDVRSTDWIDHRTIGTGIIDFPRFFESLRRIGYNRLLVLELEEPDTIEALNTSRAYVERLIASGAATRQNP